MRYFIFPLMFLICLSVASAQLYWYEPYLYNLDRVLNYRNFSGNFTASYFFGNGSQLTDIEGVADGVGMLNNTYAQLSDLNVTGTLNVTGESFLTGGVNGTALTLIVGWGNLTGVPDYALNSDVTNNFTRLTNDIENDTIIRDYNTTWIIQNDRDSNCSVDGSCDLICYDSELGNYYNYSDIVELGYWLDMDNVTIDNDSIIRDYNDTWVFGLLNSSTDMVNALLGTYPNLDTDSTDDLSLTTLENTTIIRDYNTSWIKENQNFYSENITDALNNATKPNGSNHFATLYDLTMGNFTVITTVNVRNDEPVTLNRGDPVRFTGYISGNSRQKVLYANQSEKTYHADCLVGETIGSGSSGICVVTGTVIQVDTSKFSELDDLYLAEHGNLTSLKPVNAHCIQKVGMVLRNHSTQGVIWVLGAGRCNDVPGNFSISGNITALYYYGDGSFLTNLNIDNSTIIRDYNTTWIIQNDRDSNCSVDGSCELICYDSEIGVYYNQTDVAELGFFNDEVNLTALLDDNYKDINDIYGNCSGSNCILGWGNLTGVADYANMSDLVQNCTSDGSCPLISYDSELGDYANITDLIHNCTDEGSCSLITYDSELGDYANISDLIQNETDRVDTIIDDYIPKNRTESEGVLRDNIDKNITDVRGNIDENVTDVRGNIDDNFTRLTNDVENDTIIRAGNTSWITDNQDSGGGIANNTFAILKELEVTENSNHTGGLSVPTLSSCDTIDTDANGTLKCGTDEGAGSAEEYWALDEDWIGNVSDVATVNKTKVGLLNTSLLTEIKTVNTSLATELGTLNVSVLFDLGALNTSLLTLIKEVNTSLATELGLLNDSVLSDIGVVRQSISDNQTETLIIVRDNIDENVTDVRSNLDDNVTMLRLDIINNQTETITILRLDIDNNLTYSLTEIGNVNTSLLTEIKIVNTSLATELGTLNVSMALQLGNLNGSIKVWVAELGSFNDKDNFTNDLSDIYLNISHLGIYYNQTDIVELGSFNDKSNFTNELSLLYVNISHLGIYTNKTTVVEYGYHTANENLSAFPINTTGDFNINKNFNVTASSGNLKSEGNVTFDDFHIDRINTSHHRMWSE